MSVGRSVNKLTAAAVGNTQCTVPLLLPCLPCPTLLGVRSYLLEFIFFGKIPASSLLLPKVFLAGCLGSRIGKVGG